MLFVIVAFLLSIELALSPPRTERTRKTKRERERERERERGKNQGFGYALIYCGCGSSIFYNCGNVPAESTSPEPERFFGRRESSVPHSPSSSPTPTPSRRP